MFDFDSVLPFMLSPLGVKKSNENSVVGFLFSEAGKELRLCIITEIEANHYCPTPEIYPVSPAALTHKLTRLTHRLYIVVTLQVFN